MDNLEEIEQEETLPPQLSPKRKYLFIGIITIIIVGVGILLLLMQKGALPQAPNVTSPNIIVQDETADWQTYRNETFGYEVKYPSDWSETFINVTPYFRAARFTKITKGQDGTYLHDAIVDIIVEPNPQEKIPTEKWYGEEWAPRIPTGLDFTGVTFQESTFNGFPALQVGVSDLFFAKEQDMFQIKWSVSGTYGKELVVSTQQIYNQILSTFRFSGPIDTSNWRPYRSAKFGFEINLPVWWEVFEENDEKAVIIRPYSTLFIEVYVGNNADARDSNVCYTQYSPGFPYWDFDEGKRRPPILTEDGIELRKWENPAEKRYYVCVGGPRVSMEAISSGEVSEDLFDQIFSTFRFIVEPQCNSSSYFGCRAATSGVPPNPNTPPVCGCIPECSPEEYVFVSTGSGFWPDGSQKGTFHCTSVPPPP